jgi:hypothetical protein
MLPRLQTDLKLAGRIHRRYLDHGEAAGLAYAVQLVRQMPHLANQLYALMPAARAQTIRAAVARQHAAKAAREAAMADRLQALLARGAPQGWTLVKSEQELGSARRVQTVQRQRYGSLEACMGDARRMRDMLPAWVRPLPEGPEVVRWQSKFSKVQADADGNAPDAVEARCVQD